MLSRVSGRWPERSTEFRACTYMRSRRWHNGKAGTQNLGTDTRKDLCLEALTKTFTEIWEESMFHATK